VNAERTARDTRARQKWQAIAAGTVLVVLSYWAIVFAFVASEFESGPPPGPALAFGLALVPFVFLTVAVISRKPEFGGATVAAMLLAVAIALPVSAIARDAVTGLVAAFGAGGIVSLRREVDHSWQARTWGVVAATTFILVILRLVPIFGLIIAPIITLPSIGVADLIVEGRAVQANEELDGPEEPA